uniref:Putative secreted protein n=1 Tax=Ixodes ricinus TaxID=34613 RepID=A0A6B0TXB1_IXORI
MLLFMCKKRCISSNLFRLIRSATGAYLVPPCQNILNCGIFITPQSTRIDKYFLISSPVTPKLLPDCCTP